MSEARITLSGYLPAKNGLERMAGQLADAFEDAHHAGDQTGESTRVVVVGVLDVASIKLPAEPDAPRAVAVRFVSVEALTDKDIAQTARVLLKQAQEARAGSSDQALEGIDNAIVTASAGTPTAPVEGGRKRTARKATTPKGGRRLGVAGVTGDE